MMQSSDCTMLSYERQQQKDVSIQQNSEPWRQGEELNKLQCRHRMITAGCFKGERLRLPKRRLAEEDGQS